MGDSVSKDNFAVYYLRCDLGAFTRFRFGLAIQIAGSIAFGRLFCRSSILGHGNPRPPADYKVFAEPDLSGSRLPPETT